MTFDTIGYDGTVFRDFYVRRDPSSGPGWFIFGRDPNKYGVDEQGRGRYIKLCGWRTVRRHPHYNVPVRHGWRRKADAAVALANLGY